MGALRAHLTITDNHGRPTQGISEIFIWREEAKTNDDDVLTYYAARMSPEEFSYNTESIDVRTFAESDTDSSYEVKPPHVTFRHKYSEGAEICVARAILALEAEGI
jgi:hypothetical protein